MKERNIIAVFSALACFALLSIAQAAPSPETPDPASTCAFCTADGTRALFNATAGGGTANSAFGWWALFSTTDASFSTAVGAAALILDTTGTNTAVGAGALLSNTTGFGNNAFGAFALLNNVGGFFNNAHGHNCLRNNNSGDQNNAFGDETLFTNTTGSFNSAFGDDALHDCTSGASNVAMGDEA